MFRTKEKLTAILVAIVTFAATLLLGFATLLGMPQKVSTAKADTTTQYVKVTSAPTDWSGTYLIVCETSKVAFNGGLTTLDASGNTISVTITDGTISSTKATDAATFTIAKSETSYTIQSKSGYYIGHTKDENKLSSSTSTSYTNTITINNDSTVNIIASGKPYLRYNASGTRFRYYKSDTYTRQQAIFLYKLIESSSSEPECEHANKVLQPVTGTKTHVYFCNDCKQTVGEAVACDWSNGACACGSTKPVDFTLVTDANKLQVGTEIIIVAKDSNCALSTTQNPNNRGQATVTKDGTTVSFGTDAQVITLKAGTTSGTFAFYVEGDSVGYLYAASSGSNYLRTEETLSANSSWKITIANEVASIIAQGTNSRNVLQYNQDSSLFSCYASASQKAIAIYANPETLSDCNHEGATSEVTTPATCTTAGEMTYTCTCGKTWTEEISATGHVNTEIRHIDGTDTHAEYCIACGAIQGEAVACSGSAATSNNDETTHTVTCDDCGHQFSQKCTWEGETTLTCSACHATKETARCTITFSVFGSTDVIEAKQQYINKTIELPDTLDNLPMGATFVGWTTNENATTADGVLTGNYTVKEDETLYALISYVRHESATAYEKVTETSKLQAGTKIVIVAKDSNFALSTNQKDKNRGQADVTKDGTTVSFGNDVQIITLENGKIDGTFAFNVGNGYLYAASSSSNHLKTQSSLTENSSWKITIAADGTASIVAQGENTRNVFQYNESSSLFSCYDSASQKAIQLYAATTVQVPVTAYTTTLTAKFNSASLTIGTDLTMNYYATVDAVYTDLKAQFTVAGDVIEVDGEYDTKTGRYVFSLALPPQCMADNISAVLLSGETEIARMDNYSVRDYAINTLNTTTSNELKALLHELLRYGAAAQQYTGYNTGDLATAGVSLPAAADVNATDKYKLTNHIENGTADDYPVYINAVGVRFENVNKIYVKFNATAENVSVRISRGGVEVETIALNDTILYTNEIYATAFDEVFTFEVFVGETKTQTLTYSVNSYVANRAAAGSTDAMTDLAKALYLYGEAAKAYAPFAN